MLVSGVKTEVFFGKVGDNIIRPSKELKLQAITNDTDFTTAPSLGQLATDVKTKADIISRLSYCVPPHLL